MKRSKTCFIHTEAERQTIFAGFKSWIGNWKVNRWSDIIREELNTIRVKY